MIDINLRPLTIEDARVSVKWRNNPKIWEYTGSRPDHEISFAEEHDWLARVLLNSNEKRFAICLTESDQYIGNVQLTNIDKISAEFHIFIGCASMWGKGIGKAATKLMLEYGFTVLGLEEINLSVKKNHLVAVGLYEGIGFSGVGMMDKHSLKMVCKSSNYLEHRHN
jgi:diamine N-acetyltransferase